MCPFSGVNWGRPISTGKCVANSISLLRILGLSHDAYIPPEQVATKLQTLIKLEGTQAAPVTGVSFRGVGWRDAAYCELQYKILLLGELSIENAERMENFPWKMMMFD